MASHSDELVTRIYRADINCNISKPRLIAQYQVSQSEKCLCTLNSLITGIGDYLMRVVGSVPVDLKITLQVYDEMGWEYSYHRNTFGPFYYKGQGTSNVWVWRRKVGLEALFRILTINPEYKSNYAGAFVIPMLYGCFCRIPSTFTQTSYQMTNYLR